VYLLLFISLAILLD